MQALAWLAGRASDGNRSRRLRVRLTDPVLALGSATAIATRFGQLIVRTPRRISIGKFHSFNEISHHFSFLA
jgi:hypothetical protein